MTITRKTDALKLDQRVMHDLLTALSWVQWPQRPTTANQLLEGQVIDTRLGPAFIKYMPTEDKIGRQYLTGWLHVRFVDVERAAVELGSDNHFNRFSGKWNWMTIGEDGFALHRCMEALKKLEPEPSAA